MVKFFNHSFTHDYPFPTVTLAYFLRYPNPLSTHVISTDVIASHFDPATQRLYTARLHLKRSKIPSAILKLLPTSFFSSTTTSPTTGHSQSYILERSIVAIKEGVMVTESKNLDMTSVLTVMERQLYQRPGADLSRFFETFEPIPGFQLQVPEPRAVSEGHIVERDGETTLVTTKVEMISRLGQASSRVRKAWWREKDEEAEAAPPKVGFWRSLSTNSIQRSIEAVGLRRAQRAVPRSKEGMNVVLERLRYGGLVGVLEGMRKDREQMSEIY